MNTSLNNHSLATRSGSTLGRRGLRLKHWQHRDDAGEEPERLHDAHDDKGVRSDAVNDQPHCGFELSFCYFTKCSQDNRIRFIELGD